MTREEALKMAKADLKCMERDISGQDEMCNNHKCDECRLNYERGNMGERKEWLRLVIKALEQEPCEDAISKQAVIDAIDKWVKNMGVLIALPANKVTPLFEYVHELPSVNPQSKMGCEGCIYEKTDEPFNKDEWRERIQRSLFTHEEWKKVMKAMDEIYDMQKEEQLIGELYPGEFENLE